MRIAICEDEVKAGQELKEMMEALGREITLYHDAQSLFDDWKRGVRFDAVFTDIVMDNESAGMDLCKSLSKEEKVFLIIVTNYIEYAPEGYRNGVFRYLLKPLTRDAVDQVFEDMDRELEKNGKLVVNAFDGDRVLSGRDILYVEVHGRYLDIHIMGMQETETVVVMQSLKEFAASLPGQGFFRINRNQLVNLGRITMVKQGSLLLDNGTSLSISRRQQRELQDALARYLA